MVNVSCHNIKNGKKKHEGVFCTGVSGKKPNRLELSANKILFFEWVATSCYYRRSSSACLNHLFTRTATIVRSPVSFYYVEITYWFNNNT